MLCVPEASGAQFETPLVYSNDNWVEKCGHSGNTSEKGAPGCGHVRAGRRVHC